MAKLRKEKESLVQDELDRKSVTADENLEETDSQSTESIEPSPADKELEKPDPPMSIVSSAFCPLPRSAGPKTDSGAA